MTKRKSYIVMWYNDGEQRVSYRDAVSAEAAARSVAKDWGIDDGTEVDVLETVGPTQYFTVNDKVTKVVSPVS